MTNRIEVTKSSPKNCTRRYAISVIMGEFTDRREVARCEQERDWIAHHWSTETGLPVVMKEA